MTRFDRDLGWSERFHPIIEEILGDHLRLRFVPTDGGGRDDRRGVDWLYVAPGYAVQSRVRRPGRWGCNEFTVRTVDRPSGSELDNFLGGTVTHMLYAVAADHDTPSLAQWCLHDIAVFAANYRHVPDTRNTDGTTFQAHRVSAYPPEMVLADHRGRGILQRQRTLF